MWVVFDANAVFLRAFLLATHSGCIGSEPANKTAPREAIFFSANEDCISANHMARILIWRRISLTSRKHLQYVYAHVHVRTMYLKYAPYDWLKYWGMAILVCRKKIALGSYITIDTIVW